MVQRQEQRFKFGKNWSRFLTVLDEERIQQAEHSLKQMLGAQDFKQKRFVDVGSGSGLFSLAARRLGASVRSFDYDEQSVACTAELRRRYFADDPQWRVERGSALDADYLRSLGQFDVVYSWGVLHHTGQMWTALANVAQLAAPGAQLFVSIYNDQGWKSRAWRQIKRLYNVLPAWLRPALVVPCFAAIQGAITLRDALKGDPLRTWKLYRTRRGMSPWHDMVDWVGGYPFEVARPQEIADFFAERGFRLENSRTVGRRMGCNEFVFRKA